MTSSKAKTESGNDDSHARDSHPHSPASSLDKPNAAGSASSSPKSLKNSTLLPDRYQDQYQELFQLDEDFIHLNHAAVAPWPKATFQAVSQFALENSRQGSWNYRLWMQREQELREQLCRVIGVDDSACLALVKNTSEALSFVAYGLTWQAGDNIVISNQEFPSNRIVWESLRQFGVEIRYADISADTDIESALFDACDRHTRLLSISAVQFASGIRLNLARLGEYCRSREILFCVDAIQQAGALAMDLQACDVDFAMADGHKWLLGPEGLGFFYVRAALLDRLRLNQYGWHMVEDFTNFDKREWQVANSARRFECGSPNMTAVHALHASLQVIESVGLARIASQILNNSQFLVQQLKLISGARLLTPENPQQHAGIVSFYLDGKDMNALFQQLSERKVFCALRANALRFSPHFYTPRAQLEYCLDIVRDFAGNA